MLSFADKVGRVWAKNLAMPRSSSPWDMTQQWGQRSSSHPSAPLPGAPTHDCPHCGKQYKWKITLNRHLRLECGKEPQFPCPLCPMKFKRKDQMLSHVNSRRHQYKTDFFPENKL